MKEHIEALLAREMERFEEVAERQIAVSENLEELNQENRSLILEASARKDRIDFLNAMLREEEISELNWEEETENARDVL